MCSGFGIYRIDGSMCLLVFSKSESISTMFMGCHEVIHSVMGNRFFALCTSSVSKILRAGTFLYESRYSVCLSVCPSVRPPGYYLFFLFMMCFKNNNILSASHIAA